MASVVLWLVTVLAGATLALAGCSQPASPTLEVKTPSTRSPDQMSGAAWGKKWETIVAEAKREGTVSVYTLWRPETRIALSQAFKQRYGIELEFSPFSRGAEMVAKVQAENRAGLYLADVFGGGISTFLTIMKPDGLLGPIEPLLILPDVLDPKVWRPGKVPFSDKDGLALGMIGLVHRTSLYNTELVKPGEISTYKDLLKPQYKGKITLNDPTISGAGIGPVAHLGYNLWGEAEMTDFLTRLVRDQQVAIQRDNRAHIESVAKGKYSIAMAALSDMAAEFVALGAPVDFAIVKEDTRVTAGGGGLGVPKKFAHPNAATVFVNWLLTKEGQSLFAESFGNPSTRIDASTQGISPLVIPQAGEKYYYETEDYVTEAMGKWMGLSKKIIDDAMKK